MTERCNSECRYCYKKSLNEFDNELEKKFEFDFSAPCNFNVNIKKLKRFLERDKSPKVIFYGGEPLLESKKVMEIIDALENVNEFCIQTNGKLLDQIPENYLKKFSKILISFDGNEERTDFNRGKGTYKLLMNNLQKIRKKTNAEIVARMTLSFPDIFEQTNHLIKLIEQNLINSIHWQIDAGFYKNDFTEDFETFVQIYNEQLSKLIDFWIDYMKKNKKVLKLYPLLGIFESLYYDKKTKLRCGSGYANYTITTNGNITACPIMNSIKNFYVGNLDSNPNNLKKIYVEGNCFKCNYLDLCGGRCLYANKAQLWPDEGQKLICETIIHLIEELRKKIPEIRNLIDKKIVNEKDFEYEKYFGPEIIP